MVGSMFARLPLVLALLAPVLAACGDSGESPSTGGGGSDTVGGGGSGAGTADGGAPSSGGAPAVGGGGSGGEAPEPDPCTLAEPTCPGAAPSSDGDGLVPLDRCAFALQRADTFDTFAPLVDALETKATKVTLADVLADLNRTAEPISAAAVPGNPPGVNLSFRWEDAENDKPTWVPQGITGSADASADGLVNGRRVVLVSFYWKEEEAPATPAKGVRLALVDITNPQDPKYRFLLLVEPKADANWGIVDIHAGGIAWFGDYLYVAATGYGVRVFDMRNIFQADTTEDVIGCDATVCKAGLYKYAIPQVGGFSRMTPCETKPIFSFVGLDKSASPPALITGEYCSDTACPGPLAGRVFRYPIDPATGLLGDTTYAKDAFYMGERQVQGAASIGDTFFLSSSAPAGGAGALFRVTVDGRATLGWSDTPEDLMVDAVNDSLFGLSEGTSERAVYASDLDALQ